MSSAKKHSPSPRVLYWPLKRRHLAPAQAKPSAAERGCAACLDLLCTGHPDIPPAVSVAPTGGCLRPEGQEGGAGTPGLQSQEQHQNHLHILMLFQVLLFHVLQIGHVSRSSGMRAHA
jgi:hypothetical protein